METNNECTQIATLYNTLKSLLNSDHYIPYSEYSEIIPKYKDVIAFFDVLKKSDMLSSFCEKHSLPIQTVLLASGVYNKLQECIDKTNDNFITSSLIKEQSYLDNILHDVDPGIVLDEDQRRVVLTDEDNCLVIAGAGAGKTTTIAAKVKYLVDRKDISPEDILIVSFTNKAVDELKNKIQKSLKLNCPIATFHSVGNHILHVNDQPRKVAPDGRINYVLIDYFKKTVLKNESLMNNLILFFSTYFEPEYKGNDLREFFNAASKRTYTTMKSDLDEVYHEIIDARTKKRITIRNEIVRSNQEVEIANFLYLNNLDYTYEPEYPYNIMLSHKPYTPDFIIKQNDKVVYLEHFGISENGQSNLYTQEQLAQYKRHINDKIKLHKEHGTNLIYTFASYTDRRSISEHLELLLIEAGFVLKRKPNTEIIEKLISNEDTRYFRKLVSLISRFITGFKVNAFTPDEFDRMYHSTQNVRSKLFLNICQECYLEYERYLNENDAIDFEDMINESARIIREVKEMKEKLHYKYIIIDEYQDISRQRFDLATALSEICDGKFIAVGDDWQSIYGFSGSDITFFTKFEEKMGHAKLLRIVHTYRNSQELIDIAGSFIQKNSTQIKKELISPKRINDPVIIYTYDTTPKKYNQNRRTGAMYAQAFAVQTAIEKILEYSKTEGRSTPGTILILGRFNFEADMFDRSGLFEYDRQRNRLQSVNYPKLKITFMTVHSSKGLGYDNVIILNGKNEAYGFPSKIEDDPVLGFVLKGDRSMDYAEERRLFYVAMTRTKNRVYCVAPKENPSEFLIELKHDYKNIVLVDDWNESYQRTTLKKMCPLCGFPMQFRYKENYGLKLYICTNAPEICGFMTNDYSAGKMGIMKCNRCRDGYLIVKKSRNLDYFLGCTNFTADKRGCNNTIGIDQYYEMMHYEPHSHEKQIDVPETHPAPIAPDKPKTSLPIFPSDTSSPRKDPIVVSNNEPLLFPDMEAPNTKLDAVVYKSFSLNTILKKTLTCLDNISIKKFYGIKALIATLHGDPEIETISKDLKTVPEYGALSVLEYDDIRSIVQWMLDNHYLHQTKEKYAKLHPTFDGNHYIETITKRKLENLRKYLENPKRDSFNYEEELR